MSIKLVNDEIARFLARSDPEVLCIRGKWGVGKTYTWRERLREAQQANKIGLKRYSYVSLFGINSLDELTFAIFENVLTLSDGKLKADLSTLDAFINSNVGSWRQLTRIARSLPVVKKFVGSEVTGLVSFMTIRDQIVCIDDLERKGKNLEIGDVLGLISHLREQRGCKVALILNDEELTENAKNAFEKHLEKVVDVSLVYQPTSSEVVAIAVPGVDATSMLVADRCASLGISNVRVIRRIRQFVEAINPLLKEFDEEVFKIAVASLALFCWSHDQPGEVPTLEFLTAKAKDKFGLAKDKDVPPNEAAWNALLDDYGYTWTDDFDMTLIDGVRNGYFDPEKVKTQARQLHEKIIASKADGSFESAWRSYHDTFENNETEVLDGIYDSFMRNFKYVTPMNLAGTVGLFKDLGRQEQALAMIKHYVENRNEEREFFDLDADPFGGDIRDPDIRAAFTEKCAHLERRRDVGTILRSLKDGWNDEDIVTMSSASVNEYREAFKASNGRDLRKMLSGALQFDRIVNASDGMREISRRAKEALTLIGEESAINARRVRSLGVIVAQSGDQPQAAGDLTGTMASTSKVKTMAHRSGPLLWMTLPHMAEISLRPVVKRCGYTIPHLP
jgi:hypothetical protein